MSGRLESNARLHGMTREMSLLSSPTEVSHLHTYIYIYIMNECMNYIHRHWIIWIDIWMIHIRMNEWINSSIESILTIHVNIDSNLRGAFYAQMYYMHTVQTCYWWNCKIITLRDYLFMVLKLNSDNDRENKEKEMITEDIPIIRRRNIPTILGRGNMTVHNNNED